MKRFKFWGRTQALIDDIDAFLETVEKGAQTFGEAVDAYFRGARGDFQRHRDALVQLEHRGDQLKRHIQEELYREMLLPESRSDVLHLVRQLDDILDRLKRRVELLRITQPDLPEWMQAPFGQLTQAAVDTIRALMEGSRDYFRGGEEVDAWVQKAIAAESRSDAIESRLLETIYRSGLSLAEKRALREEVDGVGKIANLAEDVADHLLIYAIKRAF